MGQNLTLPPAHTMSPVIPHTGLSAVCGGRALNTYGFLGRPNRRTRAAKESSGVKHRPPRHDIAGRRHFAAASRKNLRAPRTWKNQNRNLVCA